MGKKTQRTPKGVTGLRVVAPGAKTKTAPIFEGTKDRTRSENVPVASNQAAHPQADGADEVEGRYCGGDGAPAESGKAGGRRGAARGGPA
jgi:hypothetical protein